MTSLRLHKATLIDGTGAGPRSGVSVLVEDGRIARFAAASAPSPTTRPRSSTSNTRPNGR
jgi:hypothetical protein